MAKSRYTIQSFYYMQQHSKSRKNRQIKLATTYGVMTLAVALISIICILLVIGYRFNPVKGDLELGSLMQFRSIPSGARIVLDDDPLSFTTPGKRSVAVGEHTVKMSRSGYQDWQKTFTTDPGELRWVNSARLIPNDIETKDVFGFPELASAMPSPDRKWFLIQTSATQPNFTLVDIRNEEPETAAFSIPASIYAQSEVPEGHTFSIVEWDFGSRYALVKHTIAETTEFIVIDRTALDNPESMVNISSTLSIALQQVQFSGSSGQSFYGIENNTLRKLDSDAGTISQPVVRDVASFRLYKTNTVAYIKQPKDGRIAVGVAVNEKTRQVAEYDDTQPVFVDINEYFNDTYMAVSRGAYLGLYKNPDESTARRVASYPLTVTPQWLRMSNSGRFIIAGAATQFTSYDVETRERFDVNLPGSSIDPTRPLQWIDDYHLAVTADNDLRLIEFDGSNQHVITSTVSNYPVTLSDDGELLYSLSKVQDGFALQSSRLILK